MQIIKPPQRSGYNSQTLRELLHSGNQIVRGGSFFTSKFPPRTAHINTYPKDTRLTIVGVRLVIRKKAKHE